MKNFDGAVLAHHPDATVVLDPGGTVLYWNTAAETIFGYGAADALGLPLQSLIVGPEQWHEYEDVLQAAQSGRPYVHEAVRHRRDGSRLHVSGTAQAVHTVTGAVEYYVMALKDVTALKLQREIRLVEAKYRDLLDTLPDALLIVNVAGRIVLANIRLQALFGYARQELIGQAVETLLPPRCRLALAAHRDKLYATPSGRTATIDVELFGQRRNGGEFPIEVSSSTIETEEGLLVASTVRDASDRKHSEEVLQEANRLKSEFLANMSHELRTPLNGILGFSELLVDQRFGTLTDKQREYLGDIHECGKHLLQLINDVLDLAKVEAGKMTVYPETFAPRVAVAAVCALVAPLARKRQVKVHPATGDELPAVTLDPQKFKQVLFNLLSNAVKFTEPGGQIFIELLRQGSDRLQLTVRDTGIGIADADIGHLFEAFRQIDGGASRRFEGTGLGLSLTRKLVELHGGAVTVQSQVGVGSTFTVTLPLTWHEPAPAQ